MHFFRKTILALATVAALGSAGWWYAGRGDAAETGAWTTVRASRGDLEDSVSAQGTLQPLNYVDVGTSVSGQLRKIHVKPGDVVQEGQLLAEIDPTLYAAKVEADKAQLLVLKAQLAEKQGNLTLADDRFQRQSRMLKANATSQEDYQASVAALKSAQAQVAQVTAQIQQVESTLRGDEANLGYTKIHAPMSGTVVSLTARQGQTLNANQQAPIILRIADLQTLTVWTQVSEADVPRLKLGMDAYFTTLGNGERKRWGKLRQILPTPEVVNNVVLYNALFDVPNPEGDLGIQMTAQVFFDSAAAKDAVLVPTSAVTYAEREKGPETLMVLKDGRPQARTVKFGLRTRVQTEVTSGLAADEEVVTGNAAASARAPGGASPSLRLRL